MADLPSWLCGFVPGLLWLWLLYRKDAREPEPVPFVLGTYALGALSAFLWVRARTLLEVHWDATHVHWIDAFVVTAVGEELVKALAFLPAFLHRENDEPLDGMIYATAAALGFASLENTLFVHTSGSVAVGLERAFTSLLVHVACSGSLGYWLGALRFAGRSSRPDLVFAGMLAAVACHGCYDWLLGSGRAFALLALLGLTPLLVCGLSLQIRDAQSAR